MDVASALQALRSKPSPSSLPLVSESVQTFVMQLPIPETEQLRVLSLVGSTREALDQIITKLGLLSEKILLDHYQDFFQLPVFEDTIHTLEPYLPEYLNVHFLLIHRLLPIKQNDNIICIICDPFDRYAQQAISIALQQPVNFLLVRHTQWEKIRTTYLDNPQKTQKKNSVRDLSHDVSRLKDLASEEPIIRRVNRMIVTAIEQRATDIHIEPMAHQCQVRLRCDGILDELDILTPEEGLAVASRLKILANLDIAERRLPQDGRFSFPVEGRELDIRVSTIPADFGESVVLRLLDKANLQLDFHALGFSQEDITKMKRCVLKPHGIFLVTGPTGSGKTTTLYTLLDLLKNDNRKILTIEDPIEYRLPGVSQSQAKHAIGYTFANALRSFLRHDPDVIMVGEIRDLETAEIAIQAALTGHLVLSTLHTNDAPSAITRLLDMGVDDYLLSATLNGILAQRLVRKKNTDEAIDRRYFGRTVLCEILEINDDLRRLLNKNISIPVLTTTARESGFQTLQEYGQGLLESGITDREELQRVVGI